VTSAYDLMTVYNPTGSTATSKTYQLVYPDGKRNFFYKFGKAAGKSFSFFKKPETKVTALVSYWAVETLLFAVIMLSAQSALVFFSALFLYVYGSYALFSAVFALTK